MKPGEHRAFRFRLVDPDATLEHGGLSIEGTGRFAMVEGERSIRQAILLLLSTRPGERVGRPDYGCDLDRLAFAPNDETTAGLAIHMIRTAIEEWEPRVVIERLDAFPTPAGGGLEIRLDYRIRQEGGRGSLVVPLALSEGDL